MNLKPNEKFTLSVEEAAQYSGIGEQRLREIMDDNPTLDFILTIGRNRRRIKRPLFEKWILQQSFI